MNNFNYKRYFLFFIALGVAYLLSNFSIKNLFLANSPKMRSNLDQYFLAKIINTKENILAKLRFNISLPKFNLASNNNIVSEPVRQQKMDLLKMALSPVTKGIRAASKDGYSYTEIKLNEIEWVKITYTLKNGKTINVQYPKGTNPPPQGIYENQN